MCNLIRQYVQESSQARQSRLRSKAIILRAYQAKRSRAIGKELSCRLEPPIREFFKSTQCQQISIDKEIDGREDQQRCEPREEKYNICQQYPAGSKQKAVEEGGEYLKEEERAGDKEQWAGDKEQQIERELEERIAAIVAE